MAKITWGALDEKPRASSHAAGNICFIVIALTTNHYHYYADSATIGISLVYRYIVIFIWSYHSTSITLYTSRIVIVLRPAEPNNMANANQCWPLCVNTNPPLNLNNTDIVDASSIVAAAASLPPYTTMPSSDSSINNNNWTVTAPAPTNLGFGPHHVQFQLQPQPAAASLPPCTIMPSSSSDSSINNNNWTVAAPAPTNLGFGPHVQCQLQPSPSTSNLTCPQDLTNVNVNAVATLVVQALMQLQQQQQQQCHHHHASSQHQRQRGYVNGCNDSDSTHRSHSSSSTSSSSTSHSISSVQADESEANEFNVNDEVRFHHNPPSEDELHRYLAHGKGGHHNHYHFLLFLEGLNGFTRTSHLISNNFTTERHGGKRKRDENASPPPLPIKGAEELLLTRISLETRISNLLGFEFQFASVTHLAAFLIACGGLPRYHRTIEDKDDTRVSESVSMETKSVYQALDQDTQHAYAIATNVVNKIFLDACEPLSN